MGVGTHFLVAPSNPVIELDLIAEEREDDYGFRKQLLGFTDRVFSPDASPGLTTSFRRWRAGEPAPEELLEDGTFFTREELTEQSDHLLSGEGRRPWPVRGHASRL